MYVTKCVIGHRDKQYDLDGIVEVDDAFIKTYNIDNESDNSQNAWENKRSRGTTR
jgi:hypothetical protein